MTNLQLSQKPLAVHRLDNRYAAILHTTEALTPHDRSNGSRLHKVRRKTYFRSLPTDRGQIGHAREMLPRTDRIRPCQGAR